MTVLAYLRFVLDSDADLGAFELDLAALLDLADAQEGFLWGEVGRDPWDERTYIVVTEWQEVEQIRAFEHHLDHEPVMKRWEPHYAEKMVHRRFVPWTRPEEQA